MRACCVRYHKRWKQIRRRARTNSSGPNTNNVQNSYMASVVALTSLWIIF